MTVWDMIACTKKKRDELKVRWMALEKVKEKLDITKVMKKLQEVDRLIDILFDPVQKKLFKNLPKPPLILEELKPTVPVPPEDSSEIAFKNYAKILKKDDKDIIDHKILKMYE